MGASLLALTNLFFCSTYFSLDMTKEYTRCAHYNVWLLHQQRP